MHRLLKTTWIIMLIVLAGGIMAVAAQTTDDLPRVTITSTVDGLTLPESLPQGAVTVTYENQNDIPLLPIPARLLEGVTREAFLEAFAEGGPDAALSLVSLQGGTFVMPGLLVDVTYDLTAGDYVLLDFAAEEPSLNWFTVEASTDEFVAAEFTGDVTVMLFDFAFSIPVNMRAGDNTWHIRNMGGQWHEIAITRVDADMTLAEARELLANAEGGPDGPMPDFLWVPMSAGEHALLNVNLEPGTYLVACLLPDLSNMADMEEGAMPHIHSDMGMVQIIHVE